MTAGPKQSPQAKKALALIADGMAVSHAAKIVGLDPSTLWKALRKSFGPRKRPTVKVVEHPISKA